MTDGPRLVLRGTELRPSRERPLIMGIVNASPESFSDGALVGDLESQVERALEMRDQGADLIDVGGESGVTDRPAVEPAAEATRVVPLVERLAAEGVAVSVDTWKAQVARAALAAGAVLVNDVSGLSDPAVAEACAEHGAGLVVTHTRATPKRKSFPAYEDLIADVLAFLRDRMAVAQARGVGEDQIVPAEPSIALDAQLRRDCVEVGERAALQLLAVQDGHRAGEDVTPPGANRDRAGARAKPPSRRAGPRARRRSPGRPPRRGRAGSSPRRRVPRPRQPGCQPAGRAEIVR